MKSVKKQIKNQIDAEVWNKVDSNIFYKTSYQIVETDKVELFPSMDIVI